MGRMLGAPYVDADLGPRPRMITIHASEGNPDPQRRGQGPPRDDADRLPRRLHDVSGARYRSVVHPDPDKPTVVALEPLRDERVLPHERPLPFHEPRAVHFQWSLPPVEVLSGQEEPFFETKGVPRPKPDRPGPQLPAPPR